MYKSMKTKTTQKNSVERKTPTIIKVLRFMLFEMLGLSMLINGYKLYSTHNIELGGENWIISLLVHFTLFTMMFLGYLIVKLHYYAN